MGLGNDPSPKHQIFSELEPVVKTTLRKLHSHHEKSKEKYAVFIIFLPKYFCSPGVFCERAFRLLQAFFQHSVFSLVVGMLWLIMS